MLPNSVRKLIDSFKYLPGIGEKTAERLAFSMLNFDDDVLTDFSDAIIGVRDKIVRCSVCNNISILLYTLFPPKSKPFPDSFSKSAGITKIDRFPDSKNV